METILPLAVILVGIWCVYALFGSSDSGISTPAFRDSASGADRSVARSARAIPWDSEAISSLLPRDAHGDPIRPILVSIDYDTRGALLRWAFPAGFGTTHWERVWPEVDGYLPGDGESDVRSLSRTGVTVLVVSRDSLGGSRGASWLE